ncbi:MAG: DUF1622 domain-containing protein [Deltaproteobacteria bacterium]|jgi:uncharacterized membrane protein|nr:DUF1622 domain-containing protein [Deltaproteobacteria bacterium]
MTEFVIKLNTHVTNILALAAIFVILMGAFKGMFIYLKDILKKENAADAIKESRLELGHALSLALSFLIGASILKSTIVPKWNDIGKLITIIAIRTVLNFFLTQETTKITKERNKKKILKTNQDKEEAPKET